MNEKEACLKFVTTLILLLIFMSLLICLRQEIFLSRHTPPLGFREKWYGSCNLVTAGDSRTALAVNPEKLVINKQFKGVNFSFNGNALSEDYLDIIPALFSSNKPHVILFGISPHLFAPHAFEDNGFLRYQHQPPTWGGRFFSWLFGSKWFVFSTMTVNEIRYMLTGGNSKAPVEMITYMSGWVAATVQKANDVSKALKDYERHFQFGTVKPDAMQLFYKKIKKWSSQGIIIIGFRPPTTKQMVGLENRLSGFDESDFVQKFEQAGGCWIHVPQYDVYRSYDGSHITADAARTFSEYLSSEICSRFPRLKSTICVPDKP